MLCSETRSACFSGFEIRPAPSYDECRSIAHARLEEAVVSVYGGLGPEGEELVEAYRELMQKTSVKSQCCHGKFALPPEVRGGATDNPLQGVLP